MKRAWLIILVAALAAIVSVLFFRSRGTEARKQTSLGEFGLLEVTAAGQAFREGSWVQHIFEQAIPRAGVRIGNVKLRRPTRHKDRGNAPMTAWLRYRGTSIRAGAAAPLFGSRVVVEDSSGKQFENPPPSVRRSAGNELLIAIPIVAFPTEEEEFLLRFSPRPERGADREWVEFQIKNPSPQPPPAWILASLPETNLVDGENVVLRDVTIQPAALEFHLPRTWSVQQCVMEDQNGNRFTSTSSYSRSRPTGLLHRSGFNHRLETTQIWRIELTVAYSDEWPSEYHRIVHLSAGAPPRSITNQAGQVFSCAFDGRSLSITTLAESSRSGRGWIVKGATNGASGEALDFPRASSGGRVAGQPAWREWEPLEKACTNIVVHLVYPRTVRTEFCLNASGGGMPEPWGQR